MTCNHLEMTLNNIKQETDEKSGGSVGRIDLPLLSFCQTLSVTSSQKSQDNDLLMYS